MESNQLNHLQRLQSWLHKVADTNRYGGRTVQSDGQTVVLYDCGTWTDSHGRMVRGRFPECDITVTQCQASLSGFIVVFRLRSDRSLYAWITATAVVFALVLITARQVLTMSL